jgi:hypothetical protein
VRHCNLQSLQSCSGLHPPAHLHSFISLAQCAMHKRDTWKQMTSKVRVGSLRLQG